MAKAAWNQNWLGANSQRAYPLSELAGRTDTSGSFKVPDGLLLSLYLPVHSGLAADPARFFLRSLAVFAAGVAVSVGYDDGSPSPPVVATAVVPFTGHTEYKSYALPGSGDFDDAVGRVVVGAPEVLAALPPGQYLFSPAAGALDTDCVRPSLRGVSSITLVSGQERSARIYGDVEFAEGANVRLTAAETGDGLRQVRIDAVSGDGLNDACVCQGDVTAPCIKTINGVPPTPQGDFTLRGSNCITVSAIPNGLRYSDTCSDPCCGCVELEAVTRDLARFGEAATTLSNFQSRLDGQVAVMAQVVLGSRLGDRDCAAGGA